MNLRIFPAPCIVAGILYVLCPASALAQSATVVIQDVTVVDVADGSLQPERTVLIEGNRIAAVKPVAEVDMPPDAEIVEGAGGYLIPGLWDMHVHAAWTGRIETFFPLFLANGVTGIRDTWGSLEVADSARSAVERAELAGPARVVVAGNLVDGSARILPGSQVALTPDDGRRIVDSLHAASAPFVKVYWSLTRETYLAIAERSRELGMPFAGHVPLFVRAAEASDAGQRSVEHLHGVLTGCAEEEGAILAGYRRALKALLAGDSTRSPQEILTEGRRRALATQDDARCRDLAARFVRNGTWQVPTLVTLRGGAYLRELAAAGDERLRYVRPSDYGDDWFPESNRTAGGPSEDRPSTLQARYERKKEIVRLMAAAGVPFLAGSDTPNPWAFPGFGLHDELELLVEAGMTPLQALRAATLNPARFFDRTDELGTVDEGKLADLVLLDANPLEDIGNTRRIRAVVADGRLYRRADLDRILAEVEAMHRESEMQEPSGPSRAASAVQRTAQEVVPLAVPNDNRSPAGTLREGVLEVELEARLARWEGEESSLDPDAPDPSIVTVLAFAEPDGPARIPGPLIRVPQGTEVRVRVRNSIPDSVSIGLPGPSLREPGMSSIADSVLVVRGLRAGTAPDDTLHVTRGQAREVRYRADRPGTYLYWATASKRSIGTWTGRDAQLAGAIVVDPAGATPDPDERIFVITMLDQFPDSTRPSPRDDLFRRAINGRSWPDTERFHYAIGDTVRWRWVNASFESHPMHLHGFHYRVLARGDGTADTVYAPDERPLVVTEHMTPGSTFRMEWVPARAGNWIFHCHILDHITPTVERDEEALAGDLHEVERHALEAMAGLVLGMTISEDGPPSLDAPPHQRLRLLAQERRLDDERWLRGFVLQDGPEPPSDSVSAPGPPLLLTRGETTEITVVNRLTEPTTIHWHGLELESVFDGVAGWSRTGPRIAPLIAPGDSFAVRITPPRAGTFIYHTHMDETDQLAQGMIGPFLVLEPGEAFDPESDRVFTIGGQTDGPYPVNINGHTHPPPVTFRAGREYRLRFIHITRGTTLRLSLVRGEGTPVRWRAVAKDGADLPPALRLEGPAELRTQTGETFDFLWTPGERGEVTLVLRYESFFSEEERVVTQTFRVR